MRKILVLCTGNSCRSQMAEGFIRHYADSKVEVSSAGIIAYGLNPKVVQVMQEIGIDISNHKSESVDKYLKDNFDLVLTVCDNAQEHCPNFPASPPLTPPKGRRTGQPLTQCSSKRLHRGFPDPTNATGTEEEILNEYRKVRDEIKHYCKDLVKRYITDLKK